MKKSLSIVRNSWRRLVNMRTAIVLLCLLAVAAIPGTVFPQRTQDVDKVNEYILEKGKWGTFLDKLQMFDVFESFWFTGIYLLLFLSLIACIIPRGKEFVVSIFRKNHSFPKKINAYKNYEKIDLTTTKIDYSNKKLKKVFKTWQITEIANNENEYAFKAEKGKLKELGNLIFHTALLGLLVSVIWGKFFYFEGGISLLADDKQVFCGSSSGLYDNFRAGKFVDGTNLPSYCIKASGFKAKYLHNGQPDNYDALLAYSKTDNNFQDLPLSVNNPVRKDGLRVYLMGHGFAPKIEVIFPNGKKRVQQAIFKTEDQTTMLSSGMIKFDPPAGTFNDFEVARKNQLAVEGIFAPDARLDDNVMTSQFPTLNNPGLAVDIYVGDTGLDSGISHNVFSLNDEMKNQGRLKKISRTNLFLNKPVKLTNGAIITFTGVDSWIALQVSHDPAQIYSLIFAILTVFGLLLMLTLKERKVWIILSKKDLNIEIAADNSKNFEKEFKLIVEKIKETI